MGRKRPHPFYCASCDSIKKESDFILRGDGRRRSECNDCRRMYNKIYWISGGKERKQKYFKTEKGREVLRQSKKNQKDSDPLFKIKKSARAAVQSAIRAGLIRKASELKCVDCLNQANEYDHYLGYSQENWLDIQPVCYICHGKRTRCIQN